MPPRAGGAIEKMYRFLCDADLWASGMTILIACTLLLVGSLLKGIIGLGLPMIAIPVLTLMLGLPKALAIVAIPVAAANAWQVWQFRRSRHAVTFILPFLALGSVGIMIGTWLLASVRPELLEAGLAMIVALYLGQRLRYPDMTLPRKMGRKFAPVIGFGSGLLHGATGISGPIGITFFHAMRLPRAEFIFCTGTMFLLFSMLQLPMLGYAGILTKDSILIGLAGLPAVAAGLSLGNVIAKHVNARFFDHLVLLILAFTAGTILWRVIPILLVSAA